MAGPRYISKCKNRCLSAPSEARELQKERNFLFPRRSWQLESVLRPHIDWPANLNSMIRRNGDGQGAASCQPLRHSAAGGGANRHWHGTFDALRVPLWLMKMKMKCPKVIPTVNGCFWCCVCVFFVFVCLFVVPAYRALLPGSITRTQQRALCD